MTANPNRIEPLAQEHVVVYESPDPEGAYCYSPGLVRLPTGRLVATMDLGGPGVVNLPGPKRVAPNGKRAWQGKVFTSDNHGTTWQHRTDLQFMHAIPFRTDNATYILGHQGDLYIYRSTDDGVTWDGPHQLTEKQHWHQAPCNVHIANGCIYLVMERRASFEIKSWGVGELAPVLMRGRLDADLTKRENWTFASELSFKNVLPNIKTDPGIDYFGVPFYDCPYPRGCNADDVRGRECAPIGWLETHVVQFVDPNHYWFDPEGRTFHLWARAHTGGTGYACIAKVVEEGPEPGTGAMTTMLQTVPSGKKVLYVPCPGGQMKFHVVYDEPTKLYWLLSTQATDSMTRADRLPANRYNLPNNERRRLQLHFSKNMIDWCFAGMVAIGPVENGSRHYASMIIDDNDLHVLSRSGDERAKSAHDGNLITFHTIPNFRSLVY